VSEREPGDGLQSSGESATGKSTEMKVHPGILMKTKQGRCQVSDRQSGMGCRGRGSRSARKRAKMKVHPGMLMKTKESRFQVSGARCQTGNRGWVAEAVGAGRKEKCENEGSSGDVDENKEEHVSGVRPTFLKTKAISVPSPLSRLGSPLAGSRGSSGACSSILCPRRLGV
jgi:energy-coupling factor transporter ATP-binding protein EcfA2